MRYKVKPFYLTLTPTKRATTQAEQARFMSDFHTQLQSTIKLDPSKQWRATLVNAFIPIDLRYANVTHHQWFQYIWNKSEPIPFSQKYYYQNSFLDFCKEVNSNTEIGHGRSLCKAKVPLEVCQYNDQMYIKFTDEIPKNSFIGLRLPAKVGYRFLGSEIPRFRFLKNFDDELSFDGITCRILSEESDDVISIVFTSTNDIPKNIIALSGYKQHKGEFRRILDVECSIVESNKIAGVKGKIIRSVVENAFDFNTDTEESRQDILVPIELHEFSYIRCRLLKHKTEEPLDYKYESTVGTPFLVLKVQPL